jgi:acetate kinase
MSLGNLDALIFTAGVGENSAALRAAVCKNCNFLGIEMDAVKNAGNPVDVDISKQGSRVKVLLIQAQEDWAIARECWNNLK